MDYSSLSFFSLSLSLHFLRIDMGLNTRFYANRRHAMFTSSEKRNTTADGHENQLSTVFGYLDFA